jgi:glycosyltransferase involved in cell wall biosynthesis
MMGEDKPSVLMITIPIFPPWDNASKNRAYNIALNVRKHKIHLLTKKGDLLPWKTDNIVFEDVYRTKYVFLQKLFLGLRLLRKDPHIKVYHFFFQPAFISSLFFKYLLKIKRKRSIQTILNVFGEGDDFRKYLFADVILVSSEYMRAKLLNEGFKNVRKIDPGVDCERFSHRALSTDLRERLEIGYAPAVLFSGEYLAIRGIDHLLEAVRLVLRRLESVKFIFACRIFNKEDLIREQETKKKAKRMGVSDGIIFLQTCDEMPELIGLTDIIIFPTIEMYDKMDIPMTLLEALAMARPIIISDIPPLNEIMKSEVGIELVPGDHVGLADAIIELLTDDEKRKEMGERGRKMVLEHFNIKEIAKEYDELYREVLCEASK